MLSVRRFEDGEAAQLKRSENVEWEFWSALICIESFLSLFEFDLIELCQDTRAEKWKKIIPSCFFDASFGTEMFTIKVLAKFYGE